MTEKSSARANFGDTSSPQPPSNADFSGNGANTHGAYDSTRNGSPSLNGNGGGLATGKPCAGCVGRADNKNPQGQAPNGVAGADANAGYECDRNNGIGKTNPAHTGCVQQSVTPPPPTVTPETPKPPTVTPETPKPPTVTPETPKPPTVTPQTPETPKPPTVTPQTPETPKPPTVTPETPKPPTVTPETPKPPTVTPETPKPPTVTPQTPVTPQQPTVTPPPSEVLGVTVVRTSTPAPAAPAAAAPTQVAATQLAATGSRAPYEAAVGLALLLIGLVAMALASERRQLA